MSTAIAINWNEVQQIKEKKVVNPSSSFNKLAIELRKTAEKVKREWNSYSLDEREQLKDFAYRLIEPSKESFNPWRKIQVMAHAIYLITTRQTESFYSCVEALDLLLDNILDAVERDDSSYQAVLSDTLEQLYSDREQGQVIGAEETREWLCNVSNQALGKV